MKRKYDEARIDKQKYAANKRRQLALARKTGFAPPARVLSSRSWGSAPVMRGELKGVDSELAINPVNIDTASNTFWWLLNGIAPGTGSFNRIGKSVKLESLRFKLHIKRRAMYNTDGAYPYLPSGWCRVVLIWDKSPNGNGFPKFDDVFGTTGADGGETTRAADPLKYDNTTRFQVLRDKWITFNELNSPFAVNYAVEQEEVYADYLSFGNTKHTQYVANAATPSITDIGSGALYIGCIAGQADSGVESNDYVYVDQLSYARLRYRDN